MNLILSRKGFDTSAGGVPSPILPDGTLVSLPIPDSGSRIKYCDLVHPELNLGTMVKQLSRNKVIGRDGAHLDPDLVAGHYPRLPGWRPVLGQTGSAQGHLRKQGVANGDLFLFFGLFRVAEKRGRKWQFVPGTTPQHMLWGWLQIDEIINVDMMQEDRYPWLSYHPHLHGRPDLNNTLYLAREQLMIDGLSTKTPGSGVFKTFNPSFCLTDENSALPSQWRLPSWFYPDQRQPLSYHSKLERWQREDESCLLRCAARGQEFVLDLEQYPEALDWLGQLLE